MSAILLLLTSLFGAHTTVVDFDQPTGDLTHGDVIVERNVTKAICDDRGGVYVLGWCDGEDF